jgi:large subunit ribosomal protein L29
MAKAKVTTKKTAADIRTLTDDQIDKRVVELAKEKMNLRFQKANGQMQNTKAFLPLRQEVARLKTEQSVRRNKTNAAQSA